MALTLHHGAEEGTSTTMSTDRNRITLVVRRHGAPPGSWDASLSVESTLMFVDSLTFAGHAIRQAIDDHRHVERVIVDRSGTPMQLLQLLAALPHEFLGDVLFIQGEGESYLSAVGRGGDRILYSLKSSDVAFYLETHRLVGDTIAEPERYLSTA